MYVCVCIRDIMLFWMDQNAAMLFLKHTHYLYILLAILALPFAAANSWKLSAIDCRVPANVYNYILYIDTYCN